MRPPLSLDPRLEALARMVGPCKAFADIGTDHGRLGAYLLQTGQCDKAQFTDISADSLAKARALIERLDLGDRAVFSVGDGAEAFLEDADAVVIAGMGGDTIASIIERGVSRLRAARLILQPNVDAPALRKRLAAAGYCITDEAVVRDGRRNYIIIAAESGAAVYSEEELLIGPVLRQKRPPELLFYAQFRIRVARKALAGAEGRRPAVEAALRQEIEIWEAMEKCLRP